MDRKANASTPQATRGSHLSNSALSLAHLGSRALLGDSLGGKRLPQLISVPPWPQRQHSVFSPWIPCRERLDPGSRWQRSLTANSQARTRAEHRPARPAASSAGGAGALQEYLAPPTPSLPFCTQELSNLLPPALTGRGNDWPINPLFVPVIVHLKKEKEEMYI